MSAYREWFRIALEHAYFGPGAHGGWRLVPTFETEATLRAMRARVLALPDGLAVMAPLAALVDAEGVALTFLADAADPLVGACTLPQAPAGWILCADSRDAVREPDGAWRLHAGPVLGADALVEAAPFARPAGTAPSRPQLVVRIAPDDAAGAAAPRYVVRLDVAAAHWKYYLLDGLARRALTIVDVDERVAFERADDVALAGRPAAVFLSDRPIALRQRPSQRFQLRERAPFGDKVLMKRLPVARAGLGQRSVVGGSAVLVSEIFVNY